MEECRETEEEQLKEPRDTDGEEEADLHVVWKDEERIACLVLSCENYWQVRSQTVKAGAHGV